ncbi:MAG: GTPase HflX [Bacteroidales bacterium]|jgi:GTP-binding protein HflX|nr:GTPase HflX [Bacteroidales bacterium]MDD4703119.1 GTPase HflX [Bacteroidales bacterium]MDX9797300.1 GTPase HflX [Bacteroidales bacterium]
MIETTHMPDRAVMVGVSTPNNSFEKTQEYLEELSFLIDTAGGIAVKSFIQRLPYNDPRTFVGSGKLEEIKEYIRAEEIQFVVFDDELTPSQMRNIEKQLNCQILDRTGLILNIFAQRARTSHAKTQVELAQYQYLLPRLTRMWTHLDRQKGGLNMRGTGETQLETDRRIILSKISLLKEKLKEIDKQKIVQRKSRESLIRVALVGYTNVGKSTLMNLLAKSEVFAENKLFATLDTTVRKVVIDNLPFLLTDTVGFIRKLPHGLIESFKSTLDEVREADVLLHVVDISHSGFEEQIDVVNQTLEEIKANDKPIIMVFNKIDAYHYIQKDEDDLTPIEKENWSLDDLKASWMGNSSIPAFFISAKEKENIDEFKQAMYDSIKRLHALRYPYNNFLY